MKILVTGANGFIAREIINRLTQDGHDIIACVRRPTRLFKGHARVTVETIDFSDDNITLKSRWPALLAGVDVVINCVGVFHTVSAKTMWQIHHLAFKTLVSSCVQSDVKKIIHISALGIDKFDIDYAASKLAAEEYLQNSHIDSVIIRPSFVYGKNTYGGSALFRGMAGLPFITPVPGKGQQRLQPVHIDDLTTMVSKSLNLIGKHLLCAVGSEKIQLKSVLTQMRQWLGFGRSLKIRLPIFLLKLAAKLANWIPNSPLSSTGVTMLQTDNVASEAQQQALVTTMGFQPRGFSQGLARMVSGAEDRWHARLYFLRPLLRLSIAFIWLFTGIISLLTIHRYGYPLLAKAQIHHSWQGITFYGAVILNVLLGIATLCNYRLKLVGSLQCLLIIAYTITVSMTMPFFWLHPFAPLAKNIPLLFATLVMMALASDR